MLILSRKENESIQIGRDIEITIVQTGKGYAKIGIKAPKSLVILRKELIAQIKDENLHSVLHKSDIKQLKALREKFHKNESKSKD
ncbi:MULTISPECIES: carbon storage regulator CsrA [unclassified Campylobacter]|uniref:carbon storage regulator CsrA n=1 Tax=unclassified Campylobacter TaxID=2593542 RepID=UPI001237A08B|nr:MULTISPECIES: carbon storage regulator CsrA [unclassified Campylobacter]KAA6225895.1 carbon storage regulator CsrA [Campylobacter sp. LR185c]KAA6227019.1 carbon storage regulator CsrA [Campylobacter sp. LR196d]KAA6227590.1 carbon storage regulator CsrA [Campylobacter sp. LR286c]KAA6229455.1 carbon storage regulator CsrA [Campylobacter sp. LR264d]KAA6230700.1 carbon storage regulator CsrA [Campylobacter sp. LR291e]